jgi:hypothetical protein
MDFFPRKLGSIKCKECLHFRVRVSLIWKTYCFFLLTFSSFLLYQIFLCTEVVKIWIIPETNAMEKCPDLLSILKLPRTHKLGKVFLRISQIGSAIFFSPEILVLRFSVVSQLKPSKGCNYFIKSLIECI